MGAEVSIMVTWPYGFGYILAGVWGEGCSPHSDGSKRDTGRGLGPSNIHFKVTPLMT
jgi:hypothetical protein